MRMVRHLHGRCACVALICANVGVVCGATAMLIMGRRIENAPIFRHGLPLNLGFMDVGV